MKLMLLAGGNRESREHTSRRTQTTTAATAVANDDDADDDNDQKGALCFEMCVSSLVRVEFLQDLRNPGWVRAHVFSGSVLAFHRTPNAALAVSYFGGIFLSFITSSAAKAI